MGLLGWITNLGTAGGDAPAPPTWDYCRACGKRWRVEDEATSYFFSSAATPRGSYTSARSLILAAQPILTCPLDQPAPYDGRSPSGADLRRGDSRSSAGDVPSLPGGPLSRPVSGQS